MDSQCTDCEPHIYDSEDVTGRDLFINTLKNHADNSSQTIINLVCYESPPESYLPDVTDKTVICHDFFTDPCGWKDPSAPKSDLTSFIPLKCSSMPSEVIFFIDSLSHLTKYHGYYAAYKVLSALKQVAQKVVCLVHVDLFSFEQAEEFRFLATAFVNLQQINSKAQPGKKEAEVIYKKSGGKVIRETEAFLTDDELRIVSTVDTPRGLAIPSSGKENVDFLATFSLGLRMSDKERKAKDELILPYVKRRAGEIIYQPEADELEEDPDDDLDF